MVKGILVSPPVNESKTGLDYGFQDVDSGFQVLETGFSFQWNLDSGFQSLVGIRIPELYPDSKTEDSGFHSKKELSNNST